MKCPSCGAEIGNEAIAAALGRSGGRKGGRASGGAKAKAARRNAVQPPRPGSRPRGRPKATGYLDDHNELVLSIIQMSCNGIKPVDIAYVTGVSVSTVYKTLQKVREQ